MKITEPEIRKMSKKEMIGLSTLTSLENSRASAVWSSFTFRRHEIKHVVGKEMYSIQEYPKGLAMKDFNAQTEFKTWAAVHVQDSTSRPEGMEQIILASGLYAVFIHRGTSADFTETANYIFRTWLPGSDYMLDDRPHFEVLGSKFLGPMNPASEEEAWIPVVEKLKR